MKLVIGIALAVLLAGASGYAQEPDKDKPKEEPKKHEEPKKGEDRKGKQDEPTPAERPRQEPDRRPADHARPAQQNDRTQQQQEERNRNQQRTTQQDRAPDQQRARQTEQHSDRDAGGHENRGNARRIPQEKYRASFGREHHFHVERRDDRRFNYGGYRFIYSDPWPGDWDYGDDVYVEEIDDEYYLFNPRHPGVRILVIVAE